MRNCRKVQGMIIIHLVMMIRPIFVLFYDECFEVNICKQQNFVLSTMATELLDETIAPLIKICREIEACDELQLTQSHLF